MERELKGRGLRMCRVEAASAADNSRVWRRVHTAQLSTRRIWQMMMINGRLFCSMTIFVFFKIRQRAKHQPN